MNIKKAYHDAWKYICESRAFIYITIILFICSGIFGFVFSEQISFINFFLKELVKKTADMATGELIVFIFLNNMQSSLYGLIFGIALGIFPIIVVILNGAVVGYVLHMSWLYSGASEFWRLFPHGVFELPALFISLGLGLRLGLFVFSRHKKKVLLERLRASVLVFLLIVIPLLVIAAIIEGILIGLYR